MKTVIQRSMIAPSSHEYRHTSPLTFAAASERMLTMTLSVRNLIGLPFRGHTP